MAGKILKFSGLFIEFLLKHMKAARVIGCVLAGILVTPVAALLAVISGGAGHGHYEMARAFFPYTMLLTRLSGDTITFPLIALALAQFPLYGVVIGLATTRGRMALIVVTLVAVHAVAVVLCFSGMIPNFS